MLTRALGAGLPVAWVTGGSVYGHSTRLRSWLEEQGRSYVLAVAGNEPVRVGGHSVPVGDLWAALPEADWETRACGLGTKDPRVYAWQCRVLTEPATAEGSRHLLFRRSCTDPATGHQAYLVHAAQRCSLETLVRMAGTRLVHRERLRGRQAGGGPGRVRGAQCHRLVPAHHAGCAAGHDAAGRGAPGQKKPAGSLAAFKRSCSCCHLFSSPMPKPDSTPT